MSKTLSFVRLDFITVKPYLTIKNLLLFITMALIMTIGTDTSASAIGFLMVYAAIYVSYPFAVGEKNGIDALYATLSIKRSTVVLGRYLFALIVDVCAGLLAYVFTFLVMIVMQKNFNAEESFIVLLVVFLIYSVIQAVQLPIFFKLGYAKAKFLSYLPFIGLSLLIMISTNFTKDVALINQLIKCFGWFVANPIMAVLCGVVIWLVIMVISYQAACNHYNKRDF